MPRRESARGHGVIGPLGKPLCKARLRINGTLTRQNPCQADRLAMTGCFDRPGKPDGLSVARFGSSVTHSRRRWMGQESKKSRFGDQTASFTVVLKETRSKKLEADRKNDMLHTAAGSTRIASLSPVTGVISGPRGVGIMLPCLPAGCCWRF